MNSHHYTYSASHVTHCIYKESTEVARFRLLHSKGDHVKILGIPTPFTYHTTIYKWVFDSEVRYPSWLTESFTLDEIKRLYHEPKEYCPPKFVGDDLVIMSTYQVVIYFDSGENLVLPFKCKDDALDELDSIQNYV